MNTKIILLAAAIATAASTTFATDALLSPRAQGNQIKVVSSATETPSITITYVDSVTSVSPRVQAAQLKVVKGLSDDRNPALECIRNMPGSPKAVTACSQSVTMPGCATLAAK